MFLAFGKQTTVYRCNVIEYVGGIARIAGGTNDINGNYVEPSKYYILSLKLNIQPDRLNNTDNEQIRSLMGKDLSGLIKIYSDQKLKALSEINKTSGDKIIWNNQVYEVFESSQWPNHYKSRAILTSDKPQDFYGTNIPTIISTDFTVDFLAKENIPNFSFINSDGYIADSNNINHRNIMGISTANIQINEPIIAVYSGPVINPLWNWTIGADIFLNGTTLSETPPTTGFIQILGRATNSDTIVVEIKESILL